MPCKILPGCLVLLCLAPFCPAQQILPATQPLTAEGDLSAQMVAGIDRFLLRETAAAVSTRMKFWLRDFSSPEAYVRSVATNRERLSKIIGAIDTRLPVGSLEYVSSTTSPALVAETDRFMVHAVRWPVLEGVFGEGLWLKPKMPPVARVVAIPDADQTPEMIAGLAPGLPPERQFARRLAENGCEVLVPVLINRQDTWSGNPSINRFTNQPHREWIYRQAFELGRHIIGYEVEKVLRAVDFLSAQGTNSNTGLKIGLVGYAEGGLIAFYASALDARIDATLVSGYYDSRQQLAQEPIYRNVFGLLREFGDAEIASLIAPRDLILEFSPVPKIEGPPALRPGRNGAAPGKLATPDYDSVEAEFERVRTLLRNGDPKFFDRFKLITGTEGMSTGPGSDRALAAFLNALGVAGETVNQPAKAPEDLRRAFDSAERQHRQLKEMETYTQGLLRRSEYTRAAYFWNRLKASSPEEWQAACTGFKSNLWEDVIGRLPSPTLPVSVHSRVWSPSPAPGAENKWTGYEVTLDVYPDVFAWGILLVPKDLKPGERRPVVVCQHGLEGVPADVVTTNTNSPAFRAYKGFATGLADRGFVVFAPHNPYRGGDQFRHLQREANPLGLSLFSIIIEQHARILDWLSKQPFVDPTRIAFYGLSYGGKTAMRVPAVLDGYCLSICSADFNDWVRKNADVDFPLSYMFMNEYELPEFNLGGTFNYAEMAALIAPRPFMVERGHQDGVGIDEWVASEYAKVRGLYDELGIGDRTAIEFFNGPHTINGVGTFEFLHKHLKWPVPDVAESKSEIRNLKRVN
jgi:dienelactone hydrolase